MDYRLKALIQNIVALFPSPVDYSLYYFIQRRFGGLRQSEPLNGIGKANIINSLIQKAGRSIEDMSVLELGTGRTLDNVLGLWLCGAGRLVTVDLNPYLKEELVVESLRILKNSPGGVREALPSCKASRVFEARLAALMGFSGGLGGLLDLMSVTYKSPADARALDLPDNSIDCFVSSCVFEHIPPDALRDILLESRRLLAPSGLVVSLIDPSDHFSHSCGSISPVHFLGLTEREHAFLSGNKFMYHNRLRASDYYRLFAAIGLNTLVSEEEVDRKAVGLVNGGMHIDPGFKGYSTEDLCTTGIRFAGEFGQRPLPGQKAV